jgi:hypothetical protein
MRVTNRRRRPGFTFGGALETSKAFHKAWLQDADEPVS